MDAELGHEGLLVVQAKSGHGGETCCLVEKVEVVQSELLLDGFCDFNCGLVFLSIAVFFGKLYET